MSKDLTCKESIDDLIDPGTDQPRPSPFVLPGSNVPGSSGFRYTPQIPQQQPQLSGGFAVPKVFGTGRPTYSVADQQPMSGVLLPQSVSASSMNIDSPLARQNQNVDSPSNVRLGFTGAAPTHSNMYSIFKNLKTDPATHSSGQLVAPAVDYSSSSVINTPNVEPNRSLAATPAPLGVQSLMQQAQIRQAQQLQAAQLQAAVAAASTGGIIAPTPTYGRPQSAIHATNMQQQQNEAILTFFNQMQMQSHSNAGSEALIQMAQQAHLSNLMAQDKARKEALQREAERREAERIEAARKEAEKREAERREAERLKALEAARKEAKQRELLRQHQELFAQQQQQAAARIMQEAGVIGQRFLAANPFFDPMFSQSGVLEAGPSMQSGLLQPTSSAADVFHPQPQHPQFMSTPAPRGRPPTRGRGRGASNAVPSISHQQSPHIVQNRTFGNQVQTPNVIQPNVIRPSPIVGTGQYDFGNVDSNLMGIPRAMWNILGSPQASMLNPALLQQTTPSPRPNILRRNRTDGTPLNSAAKRRLMVDDPPQSSSSSSVINSVPDQAQLFAQHMSQIAQQQQQQASTSVTEPLKVQTDETPRKRMRKQTFESEAVPEQIKMAINLPLPIPGFRMPQQAMQPQQPEKKKRGRPRADAKQNQVQQHQIPTMTASFFVNVDSLVDDKPAKPPVQQQLPQNMFVPTQGPINVQIPAPKPKTGVGRGRGQRKSGLHAQVEIVRPEASYRPILGNFSDNQSGPLILAPLAQQGPLIPKEADVLRPATAAPSTSEPTKQANVSTPKPAQTPSVLASRRLSATTPAPSKAEQEPSTSKQKPPRKTKTPKPSKEHQEKTVQKKLEDEQKTDEAKKEEAKKASKENAEKGEDVFIVPLPPKKKDGKPVKKKELIMEEGPIRTVFDPIGKHHDSKKDGKKPLEEKKMKDGKGEEKNQMEEKTDEKESAEMNGKASKKIDDEAVAEGKTKPEDEEASTSEKKDGQNDEVKEDNETEKLNDEESAAKILDEMFDREKDRILKYFEAKKATEEAKKMFKKSQKNVRYKESFNSFRSRTTTANFFYTGRDYIKYNQQLGKAEKLMSEFAEDCGIYEKAKRLAAINEKIFRDRFRGLATRRQNQEDVDRIAQQLSSILLKRQTDKIEYALEEGKMIAKRKAKRLARRKKQQVLVNKKRIIGKQRALAILKSTKSISPVKAGTVCTDKPLTRRLTGIPLLVRQMVLFVDQQDQDRIKKEKAHNLWLEELERIHEKPKNETTRLKKDTSETLEKAKEQERKNVIRKRKAYLRERAERRKWKPLDAEPSQAYKNYMKKYLINPDKPEESARKMARNERLIKKQLAAQRKNQKNVSNTQKTITRKQPAVKNRPLKPSFADRAAIRWYRNQYKKHVSALRTAVRRQRMRKRQREIIAELERQGRYELIPKSMRSPNYVKPVKSVRTGNSGLEQLAIASEERRAQEARSAAEKKNLTTPVLPKANQPVRRTAGIVRGRTPARGHSRPIVSNNRGKTPVRGKPIVRGSLSAPGRTPTTRRQPVIVARPAQKPPARGKPVVRGSRSVPAKSIGRQPVPASSAVIEKPSKKPKVRPSQSVPTKNDVPAKLVTSEKPLVQGSRPAPGDTSASVELPVHASLSASGMLSSQRAVTSFVRGYHPSRGRHIVRSQLIVPTSQTSRGIVPAVMVRPIRESQSVPGRPIQGSGPIIIKPTIAGLASIIGSQPIFQRPSISGVSIRGGRSISGQSAFAVPATPAKQATPGIQPVQGGQPTSTIPTLRGKTSVRRGPLVRGSRSAPGRPTPIVPRAVVDKPVVVIKRPVAPVARNESVRGRTPIRGRALARGKSLLRNRFTPVNQPAHKRAVSGKPVRGSQSVPGRRATSVKPRTLGTKSIVSQSIKRVAAKTVVNVSSAKQSLKTTNKMIAVQKSGAVAKRTLGRRINLKKIIYLGRNRRRIAGKTKRKSFSRKPFSGFGFFARRGFAKRISILARTTPGVHVTRRAPFLPKKEFLKSILNILRRNLPAKRNNRKIRRVLKRTTVVKNSATALSQPNSKQLKKPTDNKKIAHAKNRVIRVKKTSEIEKSVAVDKSATHKTVIAKNNAQDQPGSSVQELPVDSKKNPKFDASSKTDKKEDKAKSEKSSKKEPEEPEHVRLKWLDCIDPASEKFKKSKNYALRHLAAEAQKPVVTEADNEEKQLIKFLLKQKKEAEQIAKKRKARMLHERSLREHIYRQQENDLARDTEYLSNLACNPASDPVNYEKFFGFPADDPQPKDNIDPHVKLQALLNVSYINRRVVKPYRTKKNPVVVPIVKPEDALTKKEIDKVVEANCRKYAESVEVYTHEQMRKAKRREQAFDNLERNTIRQKRGNPIDKGIEHEKLMAKLECVHNSKRVLEDSSTRAKRTLKAAVRKLRFLKKNKKDRKKGLKLKFKPKNKRKEYLADKDVPIPPATTPVEGQEGFICSGPSRNKKKKRVEVAVPSKVSTEKPGKSTTDKPVDPAEIASQQQKKKKGKNAADSEELLLPPPVDEGVPALYLNPRKIRALKSRDDLRHLLDHSMLGIECKVILRRLNQLKRRRRRAIMAAYDSVTRKNVLEARKRNKRNKLAITMIKYKKLKAKRVPCFHMPEFYAACDKLDRWIIDQVAVEHDLVVSFEDMLAFYDPEGHRDLIRNIKMAQDAKLSKEANEDIRLELIREKILEHEADTFTNRLSYGENCNTVVLKPTPQQVNAVLLGMSPFFKGPPLESNKIGAFVNRKGNMKIIYDNKEGVIPRTRNGLATSLMDIEFDGMDEEVTEEMADEAFRNFTLCYNYTKKKDEEQAKRREQVQKLREVARAAKKARIMAQKKAKEEKAKEKLQKSLKTASSKRKNAKYQLKKSKAAAEVSKVKLGKRKAMEGKSVVDKKKAATTLKQATKNRVGTKLPTKKTTTAKKVEPRGEVKKETKPIAEIKKNEKPTKEDIMMIARENEIKMLNTCEKIIMQQLKERQLTPEERARAERRRRQQILSTVGGVSRRTLAFKKPDIVVEKLKFANFADPLLFDEPEFIEAREKLKQQAELPREYYARCFTSVHQTTIFLLQVKHSVLSMLHARSKLSESQVRRKEKLRKYKTFIHRTMRIGKYRRKSKTQKTKPKPVQPPKDKRVYLEHYFEDDSQKQLESLDPKIWKQPRVIKPEAIKKATSEKSSHLPYSKKPADKYTDRQLKKILKKPDALAAIQEQNKKRKLILPDNTISDETLVAELMVHELLSNEPLPTRATKTSRKKGKSKRAVEAEEESEVAGPSTRLTEAEKKAKEKPKVIELSKRERVRIAMAAEAKKAEEVENIEEDVEPKKMAKEVDASKTTPGKQSKADKKLTEASPKKSRANKSEEQLTLPTKTTKESAKVRESEVDESVKLTAKKATAKSSEHQKDEEAESQKAKKSVSAKPESTKQQISEPKSKNGEEVESIKDEKNEEAKTSKAEPSKSRKRMASKSEVDEEPEKESKTTTKVMTLREALSQPTSKKSRKELDVEKGEETKTSKTDLKKNENKSQKPERDQSESAEVEETDESKEAGKDKSRGKTKELEKEEKGGAKGKRDVSKHEEGDKRSDPIAEVVAAYRKDQKLRERQMKDTEEEKREQSPEADKTSSPPPEPKKTPGRRGRKPTKQPPPPLKTPKKEPSEVIELDDSAFVPTAESATGTSRPTAAEIEIKTEMLEIEIPETVSPPVRGRRGRKSFTPRGSTTPRAKTTPRSSMTPGSSAAERRSLTPRGGNKQKTKAGKKKSLSPDSDDDDARPPPKSKPKSSAMTPTTSKRAEREHPTIDRRFDIMMQNAIKASLAEAAEKARKDEEEKKKTDEKTPKPVKAKKEVKKDSKEEDDEWKPEVKEDDEAEDYVRRSTRRSRR